MKFIGASFLLHTFLLAGLFLDFQIPEETVLTTIDFIPSSEQKPLRKKTVRPAAVVTTSTKKEEFAAPSETDVEAGLRGRAAKNDTEKYLAELRDLIARHQIYPAASRHFREEGVVQLRLLILKDGSLQKVEMSEASKYPRLNNAALKAASRAAPFKGFPAEVRQESWWITLPVRFSLSL